MKIILDKCGFLWYVIHMIKNKKNLQKLALIMKAKGKKNVLSTIRKALEKKLKK
jgi:hypothetical protein|tara:strand:- start:6889 stop:7050 length:162 start_codon:yes stop_codon:yes gene_type:complete